MSIISEYIDTNLNASMMILIIRIFLLVISAILKQEPRLSLVHTWDFFMLSKFSLLYIKMKNLKFPQVTNKLKVFLVINVNTKNTKQKVLQALKHM